VKEGENLFYPCPYLSTLIPFHTLHSLLSIHSLLSKKERVLIRYRGNRWLVWRFGGPKKGDREVEGVKGD
jgi:hypothetical protein